MTNTAVGPQRCLGRSSFEDVRQTTKGGPVQATLESAPGAFRFWPMVDGRTRGAVPVYLPNSAFLRGSP